MDQLTLRDAHKIILGARLLEDGTWRSTMIVTYADKGRQPYIGENPRPFATSDEAKEWASKHVAPLLSLIGDKVKTDENRPQGLHCTRFEWTPDGGKVYCGRAAKFRLSLNPIADDEYCCEEHVRELRKTLPPEMHYHLRRIN